VQLTEAQETAAAAVEDQWLAAGLATGPANRLAAEEGVAQAYRAAGLPPPRQTFWLGSPRAGAVAAALIAGARLPADAPAWAAAVDAALRSQGWEPGSTAGASVRTAVRTTPWSQARGAALTRFGTDGWAQLSAAAGRRSWDLVMERVAGRLRLRLREDLAELSEEFGKAASRVVLDAVYGQHDAAWLATFAAADRLWPQAPADVPVFDVERGSLDVAGSSGGTARPGGDAGGSGGDAGGSGADAGGSGGDAGGSGGDAGGSADGVAEATGGGVGATGDAGGTTGDAGGVAGTTGGASGSTDGLAGAACAGRDDLGGLAGLAAVAGEAGWWWPFADVAVLTDRPTFLSRDNVGRLHSEGAALAYADGYQLWAWRGMPIPPSLAAELPTLTCDRIRAEPNAELRRVLLEHYGYDRYLRESGARQLHTDDTGVLWHLDLPNDEPLVMVQVVNSTPEPDGTSRIYWLRVPPQTRTAREGVAWTFGLTADEYQPRMQT
jgi:hypothetical protein